MAGNIFPIFIFLTFKRFIPMASISKPPTADISLIIATVIKSLIEFAIRLILPWYIRTGSAEKATPIPILEANIMAEIPSSIDLAKRVS